MGNCLKCFQNSSDPTSGGAIDDDNNATATGVGGGLATVASNNYAATNAATAAAAAATNATTASPITYVDSPYDNSNGGGSHRLNANESCLYAEDRLPHETDELLSHHHHRNKSSGSSSSPHKISTSHCDNKRNSFKKSLIFLNGNSNHQARSNPNDVMMARVRPTNVKEYPAVSDNTLNLLFEKYKDPVEEDMIRSEGIIRLCHDLKYRPDEFAILVLAFCLNASEMCRFTKAEFIQGLRKMRADSIDKIRKRLEQKIEKLRDDMELFKDLYRFTFKFGLESDQRILPIDTAITLWKLVFTVHKPDLLDNWIAYLEQNPNLRGIPRDTWCMFLNFGEQCDIYNYDENEAWPSLFDDFVEYERARLANTKDAAATTAGDGSTTAVAANDISHDDDNNNDDTAMRMHQKLSGDLDATQNLL